MRGHFEHGALLHEGEHKRPNGRCALGAQDSRRFVGTGELSRVNASTHSAIALAD